MQLESHDLNSLRKLVRDLQDENERLKILLKAKRNRQLIKSYYNDMMWPERFASCISVDDAIKMIEDLR